MTTFEEHMRALPRLGRGELGVIVSAGRPSERAGELIRLSELASESLRATSASAGGLQLAAKGYEASRAITGPDSVDERQELMAEFACSAWRNSIGLNHWDRAAHWFYAFQDAVSESELVAAGFDSALDESRVLDGEYSGSYVILGITARLGQLVNTNAPAALSRSLELRRELQDSEWPVLSGAERQALLFEAALWEARARRCQGDVAGASELLLKLLAEVEWLSRASWTRLEVEADWVACLSEASEMTEIVRLAPGLIRQCREPWSRRIRAKVKICLGNALHCLGEHAEAVRVFRGLLENAWIAGIPELWLSVRQNLSNSLLWDGRTIEALAELRRADRLARSLRGSHIGAAFGLFRADTLARLGRLAESAAVFAATATLLEDRGYPGWAGYARVLLAEVLIGLDRPREARDVLTVAVVQLKEAGRRLEEMAAIQLLETLNSDRRSIAREGGASRLPGIGLRRR